VRGVIRLLNKGEHRLLRAVDRGQIPVSVAITIASADDQGVQRALAEAYERNDLRGKALLRARRLIELRRNQGKSLGSNGMRRRSGEQISGDQVMRAYQRERARQQVLVRKAKLCEMRLQFVVSALRSLFASESFVNLLRAEMLLTMPQFLSEQVRAKAV
jgi:ParB family transcriptional regulator, chromosome partitioning protein